jgi:hypothetical protein
VSNTVCLFSLIKKRRRSAASPQWQYLVVSIRLKIARYPGKGRSRTGDRHGLSPVDTNRPGLRTRIRLGIAWVVADAKLTARLHRNSRRNGGESGIRTHGSFFRAHTFQACALSHSATNYAYTAKDRFAPPQIIDESRSCLLSNYNFGLY